jgi:hypothetical protein
LGGGVAIDFVGVTACLTAEGDEARDARWKNEFGVADDVVLVGVFGVVVDAGEAEGGIFGFGGGVPGCVRGDAFGGAESVTNDEGFRAEAGCGLTGSGISSMASSASVIAFEGAGGTYETVVSIAAFSAAAMTASGRSSPQSYSSSAGANQQNQ